MVDASAIVAILAEESDAEALALRLDPHGTEDRFASTVTVWEASCAIARLKDTDRLKGLELVTRFRSQAAVQTVAPDDAITALAIEAAERYGMGRRSRYPGILNLGDCFSYATAKHLGAALLYKGDDFSRTDITAA